MFLKKALYDLRNPIPILIQNIMPIITVILSITDYRKWNQKEEANALNMSFASYGHTITLIEEDLNFDKKSFERQISHELFRLAMNETAKQEAQIITKDFQDYLLNMVFQHFSFRVRNVSFKRSLFIDDNEATGSKQLLYGCSKYHTEE